MWKVKLTKVAESELEAMLIQNVVTKFDLKVLLKWVDEMEEFGPVYISKSRDWYDHELGRDWIGFRASAFSSSGRVIYKVLGNEVIVEVYRVTTDHNYKK